MRTGWIILMLALATTSAHAGRTTVRFTVVDDGGKPIAGATASTSWKQESRAERTGPMTDQDGKGELTPSCLTQPARPAALMA